MAETYTEKLKLSKRDTGDLNWGQGANANLEVMDRHGQQATLRPPRTLSASLGSGGVGGNLLANTTYFYKVTAVNAAGETTEEQVPAVVEAQVTQPAVPLPVILQWETVKGATETVRSYFQANPASPWIGIGPHDGRGFCECEDCKALDGGDWDPFAAHMSMTDRYMWFFGCRNYMGC